MRFMTICNNVVDYLNNPWLVVQVQEYFGVQYLTSENATNKVNENPCRPITAHQQMNYSFNQETVANKVIGYRINNVFWYYFFLFGTVLGDELFYASFFPFWFWNIDVSVGRKFILLWTTCMYTGQVLKEIIRWPRPGYPVYKLQQKWALEYGMPSTHAMVGVAIPFSILIFTMDRYNYPTHLGVLIAFSYCCLICISRIYLGMHSILDIIVGLLLASLILVIIIPSMNWIDSMLLTSHYSPIIVIVCSISLVYYHPSADKWTPTRGDSTIVVGVCAGGLLGCWLNYQLGFIVSKDNNLFNEIPKSTKCVICVFRTSIGFIGLFVTKIFCNSITETVVALFLNKNKIEIKQSKHSLINKNKMIMDLCSKFVSYGMIAFNTLFTLPLLFYLLEINGFFFN